MVIRVTNVGPRARMSIGSARMFYALSGIYMRHGEPQPVTDVPVELYRHATDEEIASADERGLVPPPP
jgi:hypothetical protein